jgi:uncharacterized protein (TIGR00251 family)
MRISVTVKPNSKAAAVEKIGAGEFVVRVKAPAKEGRANVALVDALSDHFGVAKSRITIASGRGSKIKIIDIA